MSVLELEQLVSGVRTVSITLRDNMNKKEAKEYWNKYHRNPYCECDSIMIRNKKGDWECQRDIRHSE